MRRPRIKGIHKPVRLSPTLINIGGRQLGIGAEIDDEDGSLWSLLGLMDGTRTRPEIIAALTAERPDLATEEAADALQTIIDAGYVEDAAAPPPASLSPAEIGRYDRALTYYAWVDLTPRPSRFHAQARLKASRATVVGLGGTGSAVAAALVAAGVGDVHCVDFDRVEPGNLTRQLLYTEQDVGASKLTTAVRRLRELNSQVMVTGEETRVDSTETMARLMRDRDLLVLCADQPRHTICEWTNTAALRTGTPWMLAQYAGPMAVVGLFVPGQTCCQACLPSVGDRLREHYGAEPQELFPFTGQAVIAPSANLTGHLAALDAVYHLAGIPTSTRGLMFHLSLTDLTYHYTARPRPGRKCETCGWLEEDR
ncbi:Molybdopterin or thiamine biosynthesis adenylyltransferase [Micromonospora viridifaciens]|uniref:Molybdopterin or thiamine biosynthesis adenylyltransferase n=1 Tax=Micromonospora viridifaciens TaxID=1881 RepID=A0A1C4XQ67_MICVI|nr:ThiF family adenylyltransferase [Micromonospora viridifaciens]SCF10251.1 Molybdopterin or thiamine biosynthesis adenylyltransferase [Micromonospora viridifaciens]